MAMSAAAARARARLAVASRIAAERERDAAVAAQALTETALRGTSTTLAELGHEIISPAESLRHTAAHLRRLGESTPEWRGLLEHSFVGLMDGYIERIVRASERVRLALQMQKRHAERVRDRHRIGLNEFFRARLEAEQLSGALPYELRAAPEEVYVIADQGDLEEVVGNLLSNARRFCNGLPIVVAVTQVPPFARITLRNEGPVVPRGSEDRIFESGVSLSPGAAHVSSGLGLFLVRAAVSAMQGRVHVENDPEPATNGVTFIIDLPIYDPASEAD
jgi:signal transduction histidine kinase